MAPAPGLPFRGGAGFKPAHATEVLAEAAEGLWFEVHAENYLGEGGPLLRLLDALRERFPLSLHGVGLSIGGTGALDRDHLARLRRLVGRVRPASFSEHLAWSRHEGTCFGDLLPFPYTGATLDRVSAHVALVQDRLGMRLLLENPTSYMRVPGSEIDEIDFLSAVAARTGCGLLLDVCNIAVTARNLGFDAGDWLGRFPLDLVGEIHVAGFASEADGEGELRIDTHDRAVAEEVWQLLAAAIARGGPRPVLVERDRDLPPWTVLRAEVARADRLLRRAC